METYTVNDGKDDVVLSFDGRKPLIRIHEEGYKALGMTFEQAKELAKQVGTLIEICAKASTPGAP